MSEQWRVIPGKIIRGHQVASRQSEMYPKGTIEMQVPHFKDKGLDLGIYYLGTLNINIEPHTFKVIKPEYHFSKVHWTLNHPPEDFSFSRCRICFGGTKYDGWIYYPHPETKIRHYQDKSLIEVITAYIPSVKYGDIVQIEIQVNEIEIN